MDDLMLFAETEGLKLKAAARALQRLALINGVTQPSTSAIDLFVAYVETAVKKEDVYRVTFKCFNQIDQRCGNC
jgi:hypothetical protein